MRNEIILSTLLAGAAFLKHAGHGVAEQAVRDAYEAVKSRLKDKFSGNPDATRALELATSKPESVIRKALLAEESASVGLDQDPTLAALVKGLAEALPPSSQLSGPVVRVAGDGNVIHVAGRDLIHTGKLTHRNTITPDERHLTTEQRERVRGLIGELADRLAGDEGRPNFSAVHRMLHHRFQVASYLLIPSCRYEDTVSYLRQQRAIHRARLRRRNPTAFQHDLYRAIFAGARELGWFRQQVYGYAFEKLGLRAPLVSLKTLGAVQLKALAESLQREVRKNRVNNARSDSCIPR
jgi:hypothetical protein